jgi:hypothetical protein
VVVGSWGEIVGSSVASNDDNTTRGIIVEAVDIFFLLPPDVERHQVVVARRGHFECVSQRGLAGCKAGEQDAGQGEQEKQTCSVLVDVCNHLSLIIIIETPWY